MKPYRVLPADVVCKVSINTLADKKCYPVLKKVTADCDCVMDIYLNGKFQTYIYCKEGEKIHLLISHDHVGVVYENSMVKKVKKLIKKLIKKEK